MKRVLVTGASGFIGRQSLAPLAARGYDVHAVCRQGQPAEPATWHRVDLMDRGRVLQLLEEVRPSHLLHFAWDVTHGQYWSSPENLRWVEASLSLLGGFAERSGRRAVLAGTCAEYDWRFGFCSERVTPLAPATLYGSCKHALHSIAASFAAQAHLSLAWGRIFYLYGPHEQPGRLVPSVARSILAGKPVRCSHGNQARDFLHVRDVAEGFTALLDSAVEGPVNIASGRPVTIREVVGTLVSLFPGNPDVRLEFGAVPTPPDDPPLLVADVRRLSDEVGWTPRFDLRGGLAEFLTSAGSGAAPDAGTAPMDGIPAGP
jgi:nucleoside-diphosphate-sugar epimerase